MTPDLPLWLQDLNGLAALISAVAALVAASRAGRAADSAGKAARDAGTTAAQVTPNGGSTMRDSITTTAADVAIIRASLEALAKTTSSHGWRLGEIRRDLTAAIDRHEDDIKRIDRAIERE